MSEARPPATFDLRRVSFGATAAIVTSMGLIVGLDAVTADRTTTVGSLLIIAIADNLTDSLGVHVYQESERLVAREAFCTTVTNYLARLLVSLSFIGLVLLLPRQLSTVLAVVWGLGLLATLSLRLARARGVSPGPEILKHCTVAMVVIALSRMIGAWIPRWVG
jgi:VIT1/CCC1 family predicted Fe2+/Mn2+ transporter